MSEQNIVLSASSIGDLDCHYKFNRHRILKDWPPMLPKTPSQMWGLAIHEVLRNIYDPANGIPPHLDRLDAFIRYAFLAQPYVDSDAREHDMERARRVICNYISQDEDAEYTIAVEKQLAYAVKFEGVVFSVTARLDRIIQRESDPETCVVREYKSAGNYMSLDACWINLVTAKKMFPGFRNYELEIDSLSDDGPVDRVVHRSRDFRGYIEVVVGKVKAFRDDTVRAPSPCAACAYCPERKRGCSSAEPVNGEDLDF